MANCVDLADIMEAVSCADSDNIAGVAQEIEIGFHEDVTSYPDKPSSSSGAMSMEDAGELDGDLTIKSGAKTCKFTFTDGTGEFTMTEQGEAGGENVLYKATFERAKMSSAVFGFLNATRGRKLWAVVTDKNGTKYLLGDDVNHAKRVAADAATTGTDSASDVNKVPVSIEYVGARHLVFTGNVIKAGA
ncbi:MAG: hypothetical protein MJZ41_06325 [Bacteroidaceae bacterium]|nr:hypothetical protein [Bacteroidaceae bacterium]